VPRTEPYTRYPGTVIGRRVCVIGTSGAGKTTVARAIAERRGYTYIDNDAIIWRANWEPAPKPQIYEIKELATRGEDWVTDGNLGNDPDDELLLARCDTLVWLDLPRSVVHWQVLKRSVARVLTRERLAHGNRESLRIMLSKDSIVLWSIQSFERRRRRYGELFARRDHRHLIRLTSRRQIADWLTTI
jgi:adenylate kinase family enzyme